MSASDPLHPKRNISWGRVRELVEYHPHSGQFTWRVNGAHRGIGKIAGRKGSSGYVWIGLDGHRYSAGVLAWFYMNREWPCGVIDHKNMDRSDNRWENLRDATLPQNGANRGLQKNNTFGFKGVSKTKRGKFRARFSIHLGYFNTAEEAAAAYWEASQRMYGEFARAA